MLPSHPFIEALVKPHEDNAEMKLSAIKILEETFDPDHPSVPQAIERLNVQEKKKFPALSKILIWSVALVVLGFALYNDQEAIRLVTPHYIDPFGVQSTYTLPAGLTEQQRLLLGDPELDELTQKQQLFASDPTNPAYFTEYAAAYASQNGGALPPDFLETAARIDPENSFFLYWAAGYDGKDSVEVDFSKKTPSAPPRIVNGIKLRSLPTEDQYVIIDQTGYEEALSRIKKASGLSKFDNYEIEMMRDRRRIIPTGNSLTSFIRDITNQYGTTSPGMMSMIGLSDIMEARAEQLSKNGQKEDFIAFAAQRDAFLAAWAKSKNGSLLSELVFMAIAAREAANFHAAADRLGLTDLSEKYQKQNEAFTAERDRRDQQKDSEIAKLLSQRGSMLTHQSLTMVSSQLASPPPISDTDIKPMRMVEHELAARFGILSMAVILLLAALFVFLFRFLASCSVRMTAKRMISLLKCSDWSWIFGLGVVFPIAAFLYISRFSQVSGRDYGMAYLLFTIPGIHLIALLFSLLLAPAVITRWRLTRRAAAFKFGSRIDLLSLPVLGAIVIVSIVAYPVLVKFEVSRVALIGLAAPLVGWLGFVFFNSLRIFLGSARSRLIQSATAMAVIPAYPLAIICLCLTLPLYHQGEKYWLPKDKLHLIDPDAPDLGAYEFKVAAQKRKETNAILGF